MNAALVEDDRRPQGTLTENAQILPNREGFFLLVNAQEYEGTAP